MNGDWAFDPVASVLYGPKANNVWPTPGNSFKGTPGSTGAAGPRGLSTRQLAAGSFMQATNSQPVLSDGIITGANAIEARFVPAGGGDMQIVLSNKNGTGPVTWTASAQWPTALVPQSYTWNGESSITIQPGVENVASDPFSGGGNIYGCPPPGTEVFIRLFASCAAGVKFEYNTSTGGGMTTGTTQTDQTLSQSYNYGTGGSAQIGISGLRGAPLIASTSVAGVGDSIMRGQGDSVDGSSTFSDFGPLYYACGGFAANALPWSNCAIVGETAAQFGTIPTPRRQMYLKYADVIPMMYGTNDVGYTSGAISLANLQATLIKAWWAANGLGAKVIACTLLPRSTSTNGYIDVPGQTPVAGWGPGSVVALNNAWMRDGAPMQNGVAVAVGTVGALRAGQAGHPLAAVCNWTQDVEAGQDSGVWVVNGTPNYATPDGTHEADPMAQLMGGRLRTTINAVAAL
ncbi:SGNH/GDSL hydrolase family protein [Paraburkholderia acidiphila]|uniref:SGNH hydrolase-type esterase domain-containing protein n=1 Tax=Paraburkholderia acidiphila TaxID=2571747 RepID=A0A7Z2JAS6_9BURK|nr:SGNH/GDSL hydrolase family protein [Paraburkholderia acidiphila]QGZ56769.1 hypothetical protein FAZ97_17555 [Paraburkholderia acidiphila]